MYFNTDFKRKLSNVMCLYTVQTVYSIKIIKRKNVYSKREVL